MRFVVGLVLAIILASAFSAAQMKTVGNVTVSEKHQPTYITPYTRFYAANISGYNFTINYTKIPKVLRGTTPRLIRPTDLQQDLIRNRSSFKLDPRTCPNDIAMCYQVLERPTNITPRSSIGANYTSVSSYLLPPARIKQYVCIGNDTACVAKSTSCYCPSFKVPEPPHLYSRGACTETTHLCLQTFGSFTLCRGNFTTCQQQYGACECGKAACAAGRNTCVNERNELVMCKGGLGECLGKYKTCYCGPDLMLMQNGCTTRTHSCMKNNKTVLCHGKFESCALQHDKCDC